MKHRLFALLMVLLFPVLLFSSNTKIDSSKVEELASLGKLWGTIKYFHPYLAYKDINWDSALVQAIPKVIEAKNTNEYALALQSLLDVLEDPITVINVQNEYEKDTAALETISYSWNEDSILIISATDYRALENYNLTIRKFREINKEVINAKGVLLDLRNLKSSMSSPGSYLGYCFKESGFEKLLFSKALKRPTYRERFHIGFRPEKGYYSGGYHSSFEVRDYETVQPDSKAKDIAIVFLINSKSDLPAIAWSLKDNGFAKIFFENNGYYSPIGNTIGFVLNENLIARIRIEEMVSPEGNVNFKPDRVFVPGNDIKSFAIKELQSFIPSKSEEKTTGPQLGIFLQDLYPDDDLPTKEYRLLAAFKIWTIFNYFFPYKELMDNNWNDVFTLSIPKFYYASTPNEYRDAVREMIAHTQDSHVGASWAQKQYAMPMFKCRYIENKPILTNTYSESLKKKIDPGDEIVSIDNKSISELEKELRKKLAASTEQSMQRKLSTILFHGNDSSFVTIGIKKKNNKIHDIKTLRTNKIWNYLYYERPRNEAIRLIASDIGYADLDGLEISEVDSMFELFKGTQAIIFDLRGYANGTAKYIAPRLNQSKSQVYGALFDKPFISPKELEGKLELSYTYYQPIPMTDKPVYQGKVVVLIDERTISQAEHTCLFLESATDVTFIGTPTAGANGDVTQFYVPGNISINMTGQCVKHNDGTQLQRIGILPDIEIYPTIKGTKKGIDEVLERAIKYIESDL